ncbi:hypothetical protein [Microbacterium immunditiarum]|uniref:Uncharacterized protein n=1 Tax=Microbacterium immunditiarum TaxID=337480 RepID=A0A7Y9GKD4_9MICO|nr:hypothetical protein [Microbacterium immunditiarum]NYE18029.1 hypothetical protein [Microbacterium immunditiarum]
MVSMRVVYVTIPGRVFTLTGDDAILFEANVDRYRPFRFTVPGDREPTLINFAGLRVHRRNVTLVDDAEEASSAPI